MSINAVAPVRTSRGHSPARARILPRRETRRGARFEMEDVNGKRAPARQLRSRGVFSRPVPGRLGAPGRRERRRTGASIAETPTGGDREAPRAILGAAARSRRSVRARSRASRDPSAGSYRDGRSDRLPPPTPASTLTGQAVLQDVLRHQGPAHHRRQGTPPSPPPRRAPPTPRDHPDRSSVQSAPRSPRSRAARRRPDILGARRARPRRRPVSLAHSLTSAPLFFPPHFRPSSSGARGGHLLLRQGRVREGGVHRGGGALPSRRRWWPPTRRSPRRRALRRPHSLQEEQGPRSARRRRSRRSRSASKKYDAESRPGAGSRHHREDEDALQELRRGRPPLRRRRPPPPHRGRQPRAPRRVRHPGHRLLYVAGWIRYAGRSYAVLNKEASSKPTRARSSSTSPWRWGSCSRRARGP